MVNNVNIFSSITVTESTQQAFTLKYTRGKYTSLPTDDTDLTTLFSGTEETDVLDYDSTTVDQTGDATNTISAFLFKVRVADNASPITVSWTGQSSLAPSSATVTLEIYNYNTSSWETLDTDSSTAADTDFILSGETPIDPALVDDYFSGFFMACRVKQTTSTSTLKTDEIDINIWAAGGEQGLVDYDIIRQIPASTSDADEKNNTTLVTNNATDRGGLLNGNRFDIGVRFANITIPVGSIITAAVLNLFLTKRPSSNQSFVIKGILETNPAVWTSSTRPSQRTKTTATVNQTIGSGLNGYKTTEDITAIVQEIVNQGGWASGNATAFVIEESSTTSFIRVRDYSFGNLNTLVEIGINYTSPLTINVSDSITVAESTTCSIPSGSTNVSDNVIVSESIVATVPTEFADVFDSIAVSESISVSPTLYINVSDNVTVAESTVVSKSLNSSVFDTVNVSELTMSQLVNNISVFDSINVSESVTSVISNYDIDISDNITVSEDTVAQLVNNVSVVDNITVTENVTVLQKNLVTGIVFDSIQVSEVTTISEIYSIDVFDSIVVSEATTPQLINNADVSDGINVSESITTIIPFGEASVSSDVIVSESITALIPSGSLSVFDSITVSEDITSWKSVQQINVSDSITVADVVVDEGVLTISVVDNITVSEDIISKASPQSINVFDSVEVSESITTQSSSLFVSVVDSITVVEVITASKVLFIDVSDSVTVSESVVISGTLNTNVFDSIIVSESISGQIPYGQADVSDSIIVFENVSIQLNNYVSVSENVTVEESVSISIAGGNLDISVVDYITVSEDVNLISSGITFLQQHVPRRGHRMRFR